MTNAAVPTAPPMARLLAGRPLILRALAVLGASWVMAAASWAEVPMVPVPMTLQTYALFVIAGLAGARLTVEIVLVWLAQAAIGLPVLAGGASGMAALTGPTAGYLAGMLLAGQLVATMMEARTRWTELAYACLIGHMLVLLLGAAWLATFVGLGQAILTGVGPFCPGALVKSLAAAATLKLILSVKAR